MLASRAHWRLLIATILVLMATALLAPRWIPAPGIEENRVLATKPAFPTGLGGLADYRKATDAYVADHFPARPHLIGALNRWRMLVGVSGSERVIIGRDGWLFWDAGTHLGAARNDPPMSGREIDRWLLRFAGRTEMLRARNVPYLIIVGPTKETIYPQFAPRWMGGRPDPQRPTVALPELARITGAGEVLYLHDAVADATRRGEKTYSRHDTHWTGYGAYAGYVAFINKLHAMGVTDGPLPRSSFVMLPDRKAGPKDLAQMLGVANMVDVDFPHIDNPAGSAKARFIYLTDKQDVNAPQLVETGEVGKPVLLLTRDSFSHELLPMLLPHFSRIILAHNQDGFWRRDLIDRFKPDVVVVETVEHGLPISMDDGPPPSAATAARINGILRGIPGLNAMDPELQPSTGQILKLMTAAQPAIGCSFDIQNLKPSDDGTLMVSAAGWIFEAKAGDLTPEGYLRLQGPGVDLAAQIRIEVSRPDVAAALHDQHAETSGFHLTLDVPSLPAGAYYLTVYRQSSQRLLSCQSKQALVAPPPAPH